MDIPQAWHDALPPGSDPSVLVIALWLNRLGRLFESDLDALARKHGLIPSEFRVLGTLLLDGAPYELSPTRLNEIVILTSGGMTKAVSRLEVIGLVERRADPDDGRGVLVRLTQPGIRTGRALLAELVAGFDRQLSPVTPVRRVTIVDSLRTLLATYGDPAGRGPKSRIVRVKRIRTWSWGALACALVLVATACGGGSGDATLGKQIGATTAPPAPTVTTGLKPPPGYSETARSKVASLAIYPEPGAAQPSMTLPNPWVVDSRYPDQTVPQVFLVESRRKDGWVQVLLPVRPNGTTGWVHASDVDVIDNPYHVTIELAAHRITVTQLSTTLYQGTVAVGAPDTPTPTGKYYVRVLVKAIDPTTVYGPYAYGLSSHSETLDTFNGGDAEIGIHGNNDASVLGSNVTHGCVRMDNDAITALTRQLPLGTPVDIVA